MRKFLSSAIAIMAVSFVICSGASAQQTPASSTPATPAAKPAAKSAQTPAAKPTQTPAAKPTTGTAAKPAAAAALTTDKQKGSYAVGLNIGKSLKQQPLDLDLASLFKGITDAKNGNKPQLTDEQVDAALKLMRDQATAKVSEANMKEGQAFLAANKTKDGVVTTASGLQYKILTAGTGAKPTKDDTVVCNYKGTFIDGKEFDSSYKRGQPAEFPVGHVIPGWTEALQMMPVGSKWQLVIPSELAYGTRGAGGAIGPNETLVFEVELISIKGK
jgi:FKBP-type peptidyl-prolyl cis-trans isomerase